jgi:hypothetical protein
VYGFGRNDFTPACAASSIRPFPASPLTAIILICGLSRCNARTTQLRSSAAGGCGD